MRKLITVLFVLLLFQLGMHARAQSPYTMNYFPGNWLGHWQGTLAIFTSDGNASSLKIDLVIEATKDKSKFDFLLVYSLNQREDIRRYSMQADSSRPGQFKFVEENGIEVHAFMMGNAMISQLLAEGSLITTTYLFERDAIRFRLITSRIEPYSSSGGKNGAPSVADLEAINFQEALLRKIK